MREREIIRNRYCFHGSCHLFVCFVLAGALMASDAREVLGDEPALANALADFFKAPPEKQAQWKFSSDLEASLKDNEPRVRQAVWQAFRSAPIHGLLKQNFDAKQVRFEKYLSPYTVKSVGEKPARGWALFIAMHGGGGAPKEVNDSQWRVMQRYYRDHPEAGGYLYVALRAPNDTWNGFYDDYVYPLVANLIREFVLFADVDANKVFVMGYSHGGYGAFAIGPKMPDRFAAIHASAGAPTDGETSFKTLRNTIFTFMIGENDRAYGRIDRCRKFDEAIQGVRNADKKTYPVTMELIAGNGHTGLPDRDKIKDMYPAMRNPVPRELTWELTDTVIKDFFWLHVANPSKKQEIEATCHENHIVLKTDHVVALDLRLDSRLIEFDKPLIIEVNGSISTQRLVPSLVTLCQSVMERGDPDLAYSISVELKP